MPLPTVSLLPAGFDTHTVHAYSQLCFLIEQANESTELRKSRRENLTTNQREQIVAAIDTLRIRYAVNQSAPVKIYLKNSYTLLKRCFDDVDDSSSANQFYHNQMEKMESFFPELMGEAAEASSSSLSPIR
jgi:hypothetical protein